VDDTLTCLVGKNEAGKTALLTALYRTNPIITADAVFDETYDYPKREVEDYRFAVENNKRAPAVVVECEYELEEDDANAVASVFGPNTLKGNELTRKTYYGKNNSKFVLDVDDSAARTYLSANRGLPENLKLALSSATDWDGFTASLGAAETSEIVLFLRDLAAKINEHGLAHYVFNSVIWPRASKFLYFDEYYQLKGHANLNALIGREDTGKLEDSDHPLLGLIHLGRLDHRKLVSTKNTTELKNKLEGAGNFLTKRVVKYWSQNKHVKIEFDVRDAKLEDPEGMRQGINVWGEVYDTAHWAHTPLGTRSRGFVWFFSFLAWYEDVKRKGQNVILLLDEPGLSLHGRAQADLLEYFEAELADHQAIYTTHSPFMIDPRRFDRVRIVQDLGIDAADQLPKEQDGTKVLANVFDATDDSLFPLQGALGYEIQQTLFIGPNSLVVEGPADMLYLLAFSSQLEREGRTPLSGKWVVTPVGGSGKVPTFVALLAPQKGMNVATLLDIQARDRAQIEDLYKKKLLKKKQVMTYASFVDQNEADVEDLFDRNFYIELVNEEFKREMATPIDAAKLNAKEPRAVRAIESYLQEKPFKSGAFGHFRPARYFSENAASLWPKVSGATKDRFEAIFKQLNALLS
ncbi:MAG TPA: AAA family ATPase, partial [Acidobacteriaceae bacterium]